VFESFELGSISHFETERLTLRPMTMDDVDLLVDLNSDPEVMRFLNGGQPTPVAQVVASIEHTGGHRWCAYERSTGTFIGWFGLAPSDNGDRELGYRLARAAWGKGYASEASHALIDLAFTDLGAPRVWAQTMTVNTKSRAVMERCGLRFVRTFLGDWEPKFDGSEHGDVEYEMTRTEWEQRSTS
jgi:RimJ/RimL family protein N-acetyltransferase